MTDAVPQARPSGRDEADHPATKLGAAFLAGAAALIGLGRHWPFDVHPVVWYSPHNLDYDNVLKDMAEWAGVSLAVAGLLCLFQAWWSRRFRVSIGRLMAVVAAVAVLLQVVLVLRHREQARLAPRPAPAAAAAPG